MTQIDGRAITRRERLYFTGVLAVLGWIMVLTTTCLSCASRSVAIRGRTPSQMHQATVTIREVCPDGRRFFGSGGIVGDVVVTAAHVVRCEIVEDLTVPGTVEVDPGDGVWRPAAVVGIVEEADVASLSVGSLDSYQSPVTVGRRPIIGERVCATTGAYPTYSFKCGTVQPTTESEPDKRGDIPFDIVVEPGNSGGLVYDSLGRAVGTISTLRTCGGVPWHQICGGRATSLWAHREKLGL